MCFVALRSSGCATYGYAVRHITPERYVQYPALIFLKEGLAIHGSEDKRIPNERKYSNRNANTYRAKNSPKEYRFLSFIKLGSLGIEYEFAIFTSGRIKKNTIANGFTVLNSFA